MLTRLLLAALLLSGTTFGQQTFLSKKFQPVSSNTGKTNFIAMPFTPSFVRNKGQFNKYDINNKSEDFKSPSYGSQMGNAIVLFNANSIQFIEYKKNEKERDEKGNNVMPEHEFETYRQTLTFLNANANSEIIADKSVQEYFTYPDAAIKNGTITANGYKSLIIKNIYPGIDVTYSFKNEGGIKYSFIVSPAADVSVIRMKWSGVESIAIDESGNLRMNSQNGIFTDKAPISYYQQDENFKVVSGFSVNGDTVSFLVSHYDHTKLLIIDPWINNPNFTGYNSAYDIQHDPSGNIYVYGGADPYQLQKYTSLGTPIWTYNTNGFSYYGDFSIDSAGNAYCIHGPWGDQCVKISPAGAMVWTVGINGSGNPAIETYRIYPNPVNGQLTVMGVDATGGIRCPMVLNIDPTTGVHSPYCKYITSDFGEVRCMSVDINGDAFGLIFSVDGPGNPATNMIWKVNAANVTTGSVLDGYLVYENEMSNTDTRYSGFNGTAVSASFLFTYDGMTLKKWNKITLAQLGSVVIPGGISYVTGGLCTDVCENVYVGGPNSIMEFDSSLTLITSVATAAQVYDVNNGNIPGEIIGCGKGFFGSFTFPVTSCGSVLPPVTDFQSSKVDVCANDCINFTDLSSDATLWQWNFSGGTPSSSTDQNPQVCYLTSGIYNVMLVAFNSAGSDTLALNNYITVIAAPPTPSIQDHPGIGNDTLFFTTQPEYTSYQWLLDSTLIPNATDTFLVVPKSGNYNVRVTNENGCKIAVGINITVGLQNYMSDHVISLSPNPVQDKLYVISYALYGSVGLTIYNALGEVVLRSPLLWKGVGGEADISPLPSGIYFVQLIGEKERWVGKFIKQ